MAIKTGQELAAKCKEVAQNHKTLYVLGCIGAPLNATNKDRYCRNLSYNRQTERTVKIKSASADTFGFDCVCFIKSLLWGWFGDKSKTYGGAVYNSNNVPDIDADQMIRVCSGVSADFSNIEVGEVVWMEGHIGVYVGGGLAVECTPKWKDGVQITAVHNIGKKSGYNGRKWTKHGKLPYGKYEAAKTETKPAAEGYTLEQFIRDVQNACGAEVDGIAGPETLGKTPTLSWEKNQTHPAVEFVQKRLYALGYKQVGDADGEAGPKFREAVIAFQEDNECWRDGIITAKNKTWRKLLGME